MSRKVNQIPVNELPIQALSQIVMSLAPRTIKQYDSALRKWWSYCKDQNISPFEGKPHAVMDFLQSYLDSGKSLSYGTFNSYRSAIGIILLGDVGNDLSLRRFFRGIFRMRPPKKRQAFTWDPAIVLTFFKQLPVNEDLSLLQLSKKVTTLLALISAHRLQTLSKIKVENIVMNHEGIQIAIDELLKTSSVRSDQQVLYIPFFRGDLTPLIH